MFRINVIYTI